MARYRKIETRIWTDARVRKLSRPEPSGQFLWVRLLTGPETIIIPGVIVAGRAGLAEKLGWTPKAFAEAFAELSREGLAKACWDAGLIWIPKAIVHNPPTSPNVVLGWAKEWPEVPECSLKSEVYMGIRASIEGLSKGFQEAFAKGFGDALPKPSPNQEAGSRKQEQQQQQEEQQASPAKRATREIAKPKSKSKGVEPTPESIEVGQYLYDAICAHSPQLFEGKPPAKLAQEMRGWCNQIRLAIKDGDLTVEKAKLMIDYAHHPSDPSASPGGFSWRSNLLSGTSLRKAAQKRKLLADATAWDARGRRQPGKGKQPTDYSKIDYEGYSALLEASRERTRQ